VVETKRIFVMLCTKSRGASSSHFTLPPYEHCTVYSCCSYISEVTWQVMRRYDITILLMTSRFCLDETGNVTQQWLRNTSQYRTIQSTHPVTETTRVAVAACQIKFLSHHRRFNRQCEKAQNIRDAMNLTCTEALECPNE